MKYRFTRLNTNQSMNDAPDALTHMAYFDAVVGNTNPVGMPGMGSTSTASIPMTKAEADQLVLGKAYTFALTAVEE